MGRGETTISGFIDGLVSLTAPVEASVVPSYGAAGSWDWSGGDEWLEDCSGSSATCNVGPLMGALDMREVVKASVEML